MSNRSPTRAPRRALGLVLVVVAAAATGIRAAAVVAAVSAAARFALLTEPYQTFAITDRG